MAAGVHETWVRGLRLAHNGPKNQALWGALAKVAGDNRRADMYAGVLESLPSFASTGALGLLGNDRLIDRGPSESDAAYAARLVAAPLLWRLAGTPLGLLLALSGAGFSGMVVAQQNGLTWSLNATPVLADLANLVALPSWVTRTEKANANPPLPASADGKPAIAALTIPWWTLDNPMDANGNQYCARFAVVFPSTATNPNLGVAANLTRIQGVISKWRPAKARCVGIWVVTSGKNWGDGHLYGVSTNWGGASTVYAGA